MASLNIDGIIWQTAPHKNGASFHYRNMSIVKDDDGLIHLTNGLNILTTYSEISKVLRKGTQYCLENYASQLVPCWASNVKEA